MTNAEWVLVNQAKKGDAHGFALLYQRYYKELFYFALSVMKNASQAEDAVSAGVLKAYEQIGSLRKNSSFKSWLFQITANECRKMLRKTVYSLEDASLKEPVGEEAGFEVMDKIVVYSMGNQKIEGYMKEYREEILSDVMASDIRFDEVKGYTKEWSINGESVTLGVEKQ